MLIGLVRGGVGVMDSWCVAVGPGFRRWWAEMACDWCHGACDSPRSPLGRPEGGSARQSRPPGCRLGAAPRGAFPPCRLCKAEPPHNGRPSCASFDLGNLLGDGENTILQIPGGHLRLSQPTTDRRPPISRTAIETAINVPQTAECSRISGPNRAHLPPRAALSSPCLSFP